MKAEAKPYWGNDTFLYKFLHMLTSHHFKLGIYNLGKI
jgi:hypothetical protein